MVTARWQGHRSAMGDRYAYRGGVGDRDIKGGASIAIYTAMRVGLFLGVWLLLQLLTPLRGLWAAALAIVLSGLISLFLLNRQRAAVSSVVGGFFGRINARIDAASRAEDDWDHEPQGQSHGVDDDEVPGTDQGRDEAGSARS